MKIRRRITATRGKTWPAARSAALLVKGLCVAVWFGIFGESDSGTVELSESNSFKPSGHWFAPLAFLLACLISPLALAQTTSWKGTSSTAWNTAANWTIGVPNAGTNAVIGDANFTGANQPTVNATATCKSLTLGTGTKACTLTVTKKITVSGYVLIGTNATVTHSGAVAVTLTGNWTNSGTYNASSASASIVFAGTTQALVGNAAAFQKLTINAGSTVTLYTNISVANILTVTGTLDPRESPTYVVSGAGKLTVNSGGYLFVKAATFPANYSLTGTKTINAACTVDYAATNVNQTVTNALTYGTLRISGGGVKSLATNLNTLASSTATAGNINVVAGTFDLSSWTAKRGTTAVGGTFTVANGATLKIGGTNSFPANYATHSIGASSTIEYSGTNQTVAAEAYGNLNFSSVSGAAVKTFATNPVSVAGNLISSVGAGTAVTLTANGVLTVNGNVSLDAASTFNGGAYSNLLAGNLTNNGTFNGNTGTLTLSGAGAGLTGTGANNFNNLTVTGAGVTAATNTSLTVAGNLAATGAGTFTHTAGGTGTATLSGAAKTVSGTGLAFNNLTVFGIISTTNSLTIAGNLLVNGSLSAAVGTLTLSGAGKTISGTGTNSFRALAVTGSITTTNNFSVASDLSVSGSFNASAGTATFNGTTILSGTANLFNVMLNGTKLQPGAASTLGVGGALTLTAGTFDVTTTAPNTVNYNGAAQTIAATPYDNLTLSGSGTKTAAGALTINNDFTIGSGATFGGGTFTHSLSGNWSSPGAFTAGTSTIQLLGSRDVSLSGATTFNALTLNKNSSANVVMLATNVTVATLNLTTGTLNTAANTVTITATRTGNGVILGNITRTHTFSAGTAYAFESPANIITFSSLGTVSSVTVSATPGAVAGFPFGASVNRQYAVSLSASGAYNATLRLHYEDSELNGNSESAMKLWRNTGSWSLSGKTTNDTTANWVEQSNLTDLTGAWTLSDNNSVARWNGSVSTAWETAANWTVLQGAPSLPPSTNDIVEIGTTNFTFQPTIASAAGAKSISFGSAQAVTLTLGAGGSLQTIGNLGGTWTNNTTHTLAVGAQSLTIGGDFTLSDGTSGHAINLTASSGAVAITDSLTESGGANITFTGAGALNIGSDFNYTSGTFTPGGSTVNYNGSAAQTVAGVTYNHLAFSKTGGTATLGASATATGNLTLTNSGSLTLNAALTVSGNATLGSGTTLNGGAATFTIGGNWTNNGTFTPATGTVNFNGTGAQSIAATAINNLTINKSAGTATLAGNISLNGDLNLTAGTFDLGTNAANRGAVGGTLTLASGTTLKVGNSFPANFGTRSLAASSVVEYTGASAQTVSAESYGHLRFSNGGGNAKSLAGTATVAGDLLINSNATFSGGSASFTVSGNWTNNGTFTPVTSAGTLGGSGKNIAGTNTFNTLTVSGSYTAAGDITVNGAATISGSLAAGGNSVTFAGDLNNSGTFTSAGTVTFSGTGAQTLALNSGFASTGTVNFNGSVAPTFADATSPALRHVSIANTGGIAPVVNWNIGGDFTVTSGATFNGGSATHTFIGSFTNAGTVTSGGTLTFAPTNTVTLSLRGTAFTSSGTVTFGGTGQISLAGGAATFDTVQILNAHAAGITPSANWTINNDVFVGAGATFNGGAGLTHTISGNFSDNGIFSGGTSTVLLNGTTEIGGNGASTFNNLTVTGSLTNSADIGVTGNFTNNGVFDATGFTVTFSGGSPSAIAGSTTPTAFDSLVVAKSGATVTLAVNVSAQSDVTISSGTLDTAAFSATDASGAAALVVGAGATLKLGGNNSFPSFNSLSLDTASTVEYSGGSAQTIAAQNYGNLTSSSTGARTLASSGTIGVAGTFTPGANSYTISGSTVNFNGAGAQTVAAFNYQNLTSSSTGARTLASSGTIGVAGTFTPGANSYTVTGSTINFNGAAQTIPLFTYGHLTTSGSGAKTLGGNATAGGNVSLGGGSFADGGFTLTANGDIANAITHSGAGKISLSSGSTNHVLSGTGAFQNLELSDTNGAALSGTNLTVNGTLTLTAGKIATSTNKVIIATGGSVARTNGHVFGLLQKNVATGVTSRTFEVGDATSYAPVSVTFGNVTTAGNLIASTTAGDHSDITNSGIAIARSVNRYWTLTNSGVAFNNYSATFNFVAGDIDGGADTANFVVARRTNNVWSLPTVGTKTSTNTQATAMTAFGDFQVGQSASVPAVTMQPLSQRINLGSNVTFTITASGATPLAYRWRFNGTNIANATNTSYTINSVADTNVGNYSVVVTNLNGSDTSSNAALTINHAPLLAAISDRTIAELTTLNITNSVSDADGGTMTYSLLTAPTNASVNASGVISWTPTEAQGPGTNTFTVQVTDDGLPGLTDSKSFTVIVNDVNSAPFFTGPSNQTIYGLAPLIVTNTATDTDVPVNTLTFGLLSGPTGLTLNTNTGVINWTPTSAQCPSTNVVTVRVTDDGSPNLSATNSFTIFVAKANTMLAVSSSLNPALPGSNVTFTASASAVAPGIGAPDGTVQLRVNGSAVGSPVALASSVATMDTTSFVHGSNTVTVEYAGGANFNGSTNSLSQISDTPPVTRTNHTLSATQNAPVSASASKLVRTDTDADGDALTMNGVSSTSTNGGTVTLTNGTYTYSPPTNYAGPDLFTYTVTDGYLSVTGSVYVTVASGTAQTLNIISSTMLSGGTWRIIYAGLPSSTYYVQATTNLATPIWTTISTNVTAANGQATNDDATASSYPSRFYRTATSP